MNNDGDSKGKTATKSLQKASVMPLAMVKAELNNRIEHAANHLLPEGRRVHNEWVCGDADGTPGNSFNLCLVGDKLGLWHDFATGESGDVLGLWCRNRSMKLSDALKDAADWLGLTEASGATSSRHSPGRESTDECTESNSQNTDTVVAGSPDPATSSDPGRVSKTYMHDTPPGGLEGVDLFVYRNGGGDPVVYVKRIEQPNGSKTFRQWGRGPSKHLEENPTPAVIASEARQSLTPSTTKSEDNLRERLPRRHSPPRNDIESEVHGGETGWVPTLKYTPKPWPLYRVDEWKDSDDTVFIHEGEKAVVAALLAKLPGAHTTTLGGAQNPKQSDLSPLQNRHVIIVPDNDDPGVNYASKLTALLQGNCASVKVLRLPDVPEKGDVVEWIAQCTKSDKDDGLCRHEVAPEGVRDTWDALIETALEPVAKPADYAAILNRALDDVRDGDYGAHWETSVIHAAQQCYAEDKPAYHRFRVTLKAVGPHVRIGEWSKTVEGATKSANDDTQARQLVTYVSDHTELFHDKDNMGYVSFDQHGHTETWPLNSKGFSEWMGCRAFADLDMTPGDSTINTALNTLNGMAKYGGVEYDVHMRCAKHNRGYLIDLCDDDWRAVYVDGHGWQVLDAPPVRFIRSETACALPIPVAAGSPDPGAEHDPERVSKTRVHDVDASGCSAGTPNVFEVRERKAMPPRSGSSPDGSPVAPGSPDPGASSDPERVSKTRVHDVDASGRSAGTPNVFEVRERKAMPPRSGSSPDGSPRNEVAPKGVRDTARLASQHPTVPGSGDPGAASGGLELLKDCVNLPDDYWTLLITYMLECFRPDTPYPVLELNGEQGSAKSTTHKIIRQLIDPNRIPLRAAPKELSDIFISAGNNHVVALENISILSDKMQDALCTLATGGGFNTRQLYTNGTEFVIDVKRPVILNGITTVVTRSDLIDRTLHFDLPRIQEYRDSTAIEDFFETHRTEIFTGLLDVFSSALDILPDIELVNPPRMVDFVRLGEAVHVALDCKESFNKKFKANRQQSLLFSLESSPVMEDLLGIIRFRRQWQGTFKELLEFLNADGKDRSIKTARGMASELRRTAPAFRAQGIEVEFLGHGRNGHRVQLYESGVQNDGHNGHTDEIPF
jgi:hypothetical protein